MCNVFNIHINESLQNSSCKSFFFLACNALSSSDGKVTGIITLQARSITSDSGVI